MAENGGLLGYWEFPVETGTTDPKVIYTCPAGKSVHVTVTFCNNSDKKSARVRCGYALANGNLWLYGGAAGKVLPPTESDQFGFLLGPGEKVVVGSSLIGLSASCYGVVGAA